MLFNVVLKLKTVMLKREINIFSHEKYEKHFNAMLSDFLCSRNIMNRRKWNGIV